MPIRLARRSIDYAGELERQCATLRLPPPEREYRFHSTRKWRFDLAWPTFGVALEIEGGVFLPHRQQAAGRHTQPAGFRQDLEKYNAAAIAGWRVLRVLPEWVAKSVAVSWVYDALTETPGQAERARARLLAIARDCPKHDPYPGECLVCRIFERELDRLADQGAAAMADAITIPPMKA